MTKRLVGVDGFRAAAKTGVQPDFGVMRAAAGDPEAVGDRTVRFVFSDETIDRMGDSVKAAGWQLDEFNKNAVALWCHDSSAPPIGRAMNVHINKGKLVGDIEFMPAELSPIADTICRMVKGGWLNTVSVGFLPLEFAFSNDADRPFGIDFKKQQLLEISVCSVPANPNALVDARAKGIDIAPVVEWAEKVLANGGSVMIPRDVLEETFRAAKTPRTVRQKYLAKTTTASEWKMGAATDLPLDAEAEWDGAAAAKRMLDAAGFDGDHPDAAAAQRGFLIYDAANPTLRHSYNLPFADIIDGTLKAVKGGVAAAGTRLALAAEVGIADEARAAVDVYETAFTTTDPPVIETKAGRRLNGQNAEALQDARERNAAGQKALAEAVAHYVAAGELLQKVLDSNEAADADPDDDGDGKTAAAPVVEMDADPRALRLREVQALKDSLKP